ncbi:MAG: hypothetical protein B6241_08750 [Spirochaetaceae bacterium 4572_59]|nr:MAG: hypothetical protein B6241_08750 [Spirochaetaceae bacterium 4572_59]
MLWLWGLLADLIVGIHFLYVMFTVCGEALILSGGILKWQWVRNRIFRTLHLVSVLFVTLESLLGILCPLTQIEYNLRQRAGQHREESLSFVARLIRKVIFYDFPDLFFTLLYVGFGILVILTIIFIPMNKKED